MAGIDLYTIARFWSKVSVQDDTRSCWLWLGLTTEKGYGRFYADRRYLRAHRFAWEYINGAVPDGAMVLHACDVPACCNPHHLRTGTAQDNNEDCWAKGRGKRLIGPENGRAKLSDEQVASIRSDGRRGTEIAAQYGISSALVSMIRSGARRAQ